MKLKVCPYFNSKAIKSIWKMSRCCPSRIWRLYQERIKENKPLFFLRKSFSRLLANITDCLGEMVWNWPFFHMVFMRFIWLQNFAYCQKLNYTHMGVFFVLLFLVLFRVKKLPKVTLVLTVLLLPGNRGKYYV